MFWNHVCAQWGATMNVHQKPYANLTKILYCILTQLNRIIACLVPMLNLLRQHIHESVLAISMYMYMYVCTAVYNYDVSDTRPLFVMHNFCSYLRYSLYQAFPSLLYRRPGNKATFNTVLVYTCILHWL